MRYVFIAASALVFSAGLTACGGGGSGSSGNTAGVTVTPPPPPLFTAQP